MQMSDVIADMLTRIRNANDAKHATVDVPASNMKKAIADILLEEGYIKSYEIIDDGKQGMIHITLKYGANKEKVILITYFSNCTYVYFNGPRNVGISSALCVCRKSDCVNPNICSYSSSVYIFPVKNLALSIIACGKV